MKRLLLALAVCSCAAAPEAEPQRWVTGRVVFPAGTPADERVELFLDAHGPLDPDDVMTSLSALWPECAPWEEVARVELAENGTFRCAVPAETVRLQARIAADYLRLGYWDGTYEELDEPLVVKPELGTHVTLHFIPPPGGGHDRATLVGRTITFALHRRGQNSTGVPETIGVRVRPDGTGLARAVPADRTLWPRSCDDAGSLAPFSVAPGWSPRFEAGTRQRVDVPLREL